MWVIKSSSNSSNTTLLGNQFHKWRILIFWKLSKSVACYYYYYWYLRLDGFNQIPWLSERLSERDEPCKAHVFIFVWWCITSTGQHVGGKLLCAGSLCTCHLITGADQIAPVLHISGRSHWQWINFPLTLCPLRLTAKTVMFSLNISIN